MGLRRIYGESLAAGMAVCICRCVRMVHVSGGCMGCLKCETFTPRDADDPGASPGSPETAAPRPRE